MNSYKVRIELTEVYETWVEADNEDRAINMALNQLNNGLLEIQHDTMDATIEDIDVDTSELDDDE